MTIEFLRPQWFFAIIPLGILVFIYWRRRFAGENWRQVVDPVLMEQLLANKRGQRDDGMWWLWLFLGLLSIVALSGPVWKKLPDPVFEQQSALVIALDLSSSMDAADIKPSRLQRAQLKIADLLHQREEGQTALIAYAATPYTVSPLTDDGDTIEALLSSLSTQLMPAQGSRADLAIRQAAELLSNAGLARGDILLVTDDVSERVTDLIDQIDMGNLRLSILAVGTEQGAPIPLASGGFIKDDQGSIVIAKTERTRLASLAGKHQGVFTSMTLDDGDLVRLQKLFGDVPLLSEHQRVDFSADRWREEGPWLLLLITPLAALAFRRGFLLSLLVVVLITPVPDTVSADDGFQWRDLWKNRDQQAAEKLAQGESTQAAQLFQRADWKAAAHYRAGEYEQAIDQLQSDSSADALYNRGNALARLGRLSEAVQSYDAVLQQQPDHEDAAYNKKLVEQVLQQQQQQQQQDQSSGDGQQESDSQSSEDTTKSDDSSSQPQNSSTDSTQQTTEPSGEPQQQQEQDEGDAQSQASSAEQDSPDRPEQELTEENRPQPSEAQQQPEQTFAQSEMMEQGDSEDRLSEQAEAQWLRRIPDDPGGLLRNKFRYQYSQQQPVMEKEPW